MASVKCKNCGSDVPTTMKFCGSCGTPVELLDVSTETIVPAEPAAPTAEALSPTFIAGILILGYFLNGLFNSIYTAVTLPSRDWHDINLIRSSYLLGAAVMLIPTILLLIMMALSIPKKKAGLLIIPLALDTLLRGFHIYSTFFAMRNNPGNYAAGYYLQYQVVVSIITLSLFAVTLVAFCLFVFWKVNVIKPLVICAFAAICNDLVSPLIYEIWLAKFEYSTMFSHSSVWSESKIFLYCVAFLCLVIPTNKVSIKKN